MSGTNQSYQTASTDGLKAPEADIKGLTPAEAWFRLKKYGPNEIVFPERSLSVRRRLLFYGALIRELLTVAVIIIIKFRGRLVDRLFCRLA